jgi:hypothetical protein
MSNDRDKITKLVLRLIGLTNSRKIKWRREVPNSRELPHDRRYLNYVYITQIEVDIFRLSEFEYKSYIEDETFWEYEKALEIIDLDGRTLWRCPPNPAIEDLFRIAADATAEIDRIMQSLDSLAEAS